MHNGSLSFIPLAKRKKLITLNFSHAHHRHGDECAKHFHVFVQTVHATRHPFHVLGFGVIFCHSTIPPLRLNLTTLINQIDKKFFPYEAWNNLWTTHPIWNIAAGRSLDSLTTRPLLQRPGGDERCVHRTLPSVHFNGLLWSIILGAELWQEF